MWAADLTRDMSSAISPNLNLRDQREKVARAAAEKKKAKEGKGGKGKGAGKGAKGAKKGATNPQASHLALGNPMSINGKRSKQQRAEATKPTASTTTASKAVTGMLHLRAQVQRRYSSRKDL